MLACTCTSAPSQIIGCDLTAAADDPAHLAVWRIPAPLAARLLVEEVVCQLSVGAPIHLQGLYARSGPCPSWPHLQGTWSSCMTTCKMLWHLISPECAGGLM